MLERFGFLIFYDVWVKYLQQCYFKTFFKNTAISFWDWDPRKKVKKINFLSVNPCFKIQFSVNKKV